MNILDPEWRGDVDEIGLDFLKSLMEKSGLPPAAIRLVEELIYVHHLQSITPSSWVTGEEGYRFEIEQTKGRISLIISELSEEASPGKICPN
jgi:hypothetical protein